MRRYLLGFGLLALLPVTGVASASGSPPYTPGGSATSSTIPDDEVNTCDLRGDSIIVVDEAVSGDDVEAVTWFLSCNESPSAVDIYELELDSDDIEVLLEVLELLGYDEQFTVH
jgi:hypothetical protein